MGWFVAGYGPFRRLSGAASDAQRLMLGPQRVASLVTLFDESASLAEAMWWLQDLYPKVLEGDSSSKELMDGLMAMIGDGLLPDEHHVARYDSQGLWVERAGKKFLLEDLSDGYRTIAALVLDICRRLHAANREFSVTVNDDGSVQCDYEGIVLIDEVDVHLHVSWQQALGPWLKSHFPKIQFIVSSHSPFICQAASPNGLIRLPAPGEADRRPRFVEDELYKAIVHGGSDVAVESDLFGLDSARSSETMALNAQLVEFERRIVLNEATEKDIEEMRQLRDTISPSAKSEALNTLAALRLSMESGLA
ncbi:AAA family ATPase [Pseudarthrobacter sp. LMD1-1-1.1]|uniref:AAA family ATPase n=1 Tax=Pseudarthrobacter sp. LMD1-1-1.1 TaxID=3135242 RepID=UPI0034384887